MKTCPYCAEQIQEDAVKCRYCGEWLDGRLRAGNAVKFAPRMGYYGYPNYEYKSEMEIFGLPLIHIAQGYDPQTGAPRIARGVIAVGSIAIGGFALGGLSLGLVSFGGLSLGVFSFGGLAVGLLTAVGGGAVGGLLALGGLAISLGYALGGLTLAPHFLGGNGFDPEFLRLLERFFGGE
ncbi:MAG: zinc ribbon domain-containing protein [Chloroflexi bacterium]|nr:zinc ribbon domain-containing protein [Chloroflexota bacterium]